VDYVFGDCKRHMLMVRKNNLFFAFVKFSIYLLDHLIFYQS